MTARKHPDLADRGISATATQPAPGADWNVTELPALEAELLVALNAERVKAGAAPLATNPHVQASIEFYIQESAEFQFLSHDSPNVGDPRWPAMPWTQRLALFGSPSTAALGENLAYGFLDVPSVVSAWMSDVGHRANILQPAFVGVGCGVARWPGNGQQPTNPDGSPNNAYRGPLVWWGNDFTSEASNPPPPPPPPVLPQPGTKWRPKANPLAKPVTVTASTAVSVTYENRKGIVGHLTLAAFTKRYRPI